MLENKKYDIFISFKNSYKNKFTKDKKVAEKLYHYLSNRNLKVFFSPITLMNLGKDNWENEITTAIYQSKIFIALASKKKFMESKWTQRERTSFLTLKYLDETKAIYSYIISPMTIKDLPDDIKYFECFQEKNRNEHERLYSYIVNHLENIKNVQSITENVKNKNNITLIAKKELEKIIKLDKEVTDSMGSFFIIGLIISLIIALIYGFIKDIVVILGLAFFIFGILDSSSEKSTLEEYEKEILYHIDDEVLEEIVFLSKIRNYKSKKIYNKIIKRIEKEIKKRKNMRKN